MLINLCKALESLQALSLFYLYSYSVNSYLFGKQLQLVVKQVVALQLLTKKKVHTIFKVNCYIDVVTSF